MPVIDLFSVGRDAMLSLTHCDVCIVGSGPAGSTLARELSGTSLKVVVLESGGFTRRPELDELHAIENVGRPRAEQWSVRNRIVGGSSHTWGGRVAPFDEIDFDARAWVPASGWPMAQRDLAPYFERSAPYLGLCVGNDFSDDNFWQVARRSPPHAAPEPAKLLPFFWQFARDDEPTYPYEYTRFGRHLASKIGANVTLIAGASVLSIKTDEHANAVSGVEYAGPDGRRRSLSAARVVLCAGGIENARLLLLSNERCANGLGNTHDLVGRYLMDHLRGPCAYFELTGTAQLQKLYGRYTVNGNIFRAGLRLSPEVQRKEQLLNCAAWLGEVLAGDDPWSSVRRILSGKLSLTDAQNLLQNTAYIARGARDYFIERNGAPRKLSELVLDCMVEQLPDPDSRVTLSERRDRLGQRISKIDWRSHRVEALTMHRTAELVAQQFARMGLPVPTLAPWVLDRADIPESFVDVAHPTGTTRMSSDPRTGVVDVRGEVHGLRGLFVSGTSVFPTAGHCNPTQMIVAMAIRLADTIKQEAARSESTPPIRAFTAKEVLVTGATGRIGRVLVEDLIARGYRVRATTSKPPPEPSANLTWQRFDFMQDNDFDRLVTGCDAVLHLAAEIGKQSRMQRVNVEATRGLVLAAERAGIQAFCYTSTVSVYGSGRASEICETSPVLTVDRDVRSEYWALDYVRTYGRTKLAGELAIRELATSVRYTILRPAVVVSEQDLVNIGTWNYLKRTLAAHRHAHHVYVRDVSDAIIWSMERGLTGHGAPGSVELFNLAEDECPEPRHADFFKKAYAASGDRRFKVVTAPWIGDWLHDFLRFRSLPLRNPLWRMRFSNARLRAAGYYPRYGMAVAQAQALERLSGRRAEPQPAAAR